MVRLESQSVRTDYAYTVTMAFAGLSRNLHTDIVILQQEFSY